jgi:hypothetical protein
MQVFTVPAMTTIAAGASAHATLGAGMVGSNHRRTTAHEMVRSNGRQAIGAASEPVTGHDSVLAGERADGGTRVHR